MRLKPGGEGERKCVWDQENLQGRRSGIYFLQPGSMFNSQFRCEQSDASVERVSAHTVQPSLNGATCWDQAFSANSFPVTLKS